MLRPFPFLTAFTLALLVASLAIAGRGPSEAGSSLGLLTMLATIGVHGLAAASAWLGRLRIEELGDRLGLPAWVKAQGGKNMAKVATLAIPGAFLVCVTSWVEGSIAPPGGKSGLLAANLAFQAGAFGGEYLALAAQARLGRDLAGWPLGVSGP